MTLQGDLYSSQHLGASTNVPLTVAPFQKLVDSDNKVDGGNFLARLNRDVSEDEGWSLQLYFDRTRRASEVLDEELNTFDMDFRHRFPLGERHKMLWGLGFRYSRSHTDGTRWLFLDPPTRGIETISWFIQDTISLVPDKLSLMFGSKFECNDFTGFEFQPSARLMWTPHPKHAVWAAVSRAIRTPSLIEDDIDITLGVIPAPLPTQLRLLGDRHVKSEDLLAYELGYRFKPSDRLSFDLATFFNDYDDLMGVRSSVGNPFLLHFANNTTARTYGVEFESTWQVTDRWKLVGAYSLLKMDVDGPDTSIQGTSPEHQFNVRSMYDITDDLEFNAGVYYVDHLQSTNIPSNVRVDVGLTWRPTDHLEFSVWGQNVFDDRHPEFIDPFAQPDQQVEVGRAVFAAVKVEF
jgi:iron complex outermembrane receptor protein